ncbi:MAG: transposase [Pirellulales bacterium]
MSRTRYRIFDDHYPHFMTCTLVGWVPIFTRGEAVDIVLNSWRHLQRERQFSLLGYVILENHLHLIAAAPDLSDVMQRFKSYTAHELVALLKQRSAHTLLHALSVFKLPHKTESDHQVWQEGNHPQQMTSEEIMWQKLEYIHANPVRRGYVDDPVHWRYSSARNYAGQPGLIEVVTDWT